MKGPPALDRDQIRALEQELKLPLFVRKAQSLELTEAGAMLYAEVDPLIRQIDAVTRGFCSRLRGQPLRISVQPFFASEMFVITATSGSTTSACSPRSASPCPRSPPSCRPRR